MECLRIGAFRIVGCVIESENVSPSAYLVDERDLMFQACDDGSRSGEYAPGKEEGGERMEEDLRVSTISSIGGLERVVCDWDFCRDSASHNLLFEGEMAGTSGRLQHCG